MSFLNDTVLPGTGRLHSNEGQRRDRKRQSQSGGLLKPLVQLILNPGSAYEGFLGSNDNSAQNAQPGVLDQESRRQVLYVRIKDATTYDEWRDSAVELDRLEGNDAWKLETACAEYDVALVQARLQQLDEARINCDVSRMLFLIRTSLTRGLGGMGDLRLYKHSHIGTKTLIERYIESAKETLNALLDVSAKQSDSALEPRYVLEQLLAARQSFGRSALLLSGGGTFGMNHIGVVKSLWQAKLLPRIISGASAGSIVCAVLCSKSDQEIPQFLEQFCYGDLAVFEKGGEESILKKAARLLKFGAIFDVQNLVRVMRSLLGDITFQEAYNRTRRILNITVSSASLYELPRLLNYITAPNVMIWSAVAASCSVPFVFSAAQLFAKDPKTGKDVPWNLSPQRWIDGSVDNDLPMTRLAEMFNVNHFIVSQVNPHVVPFLMKDESLVAAEAQQSSSAVAAGPGWLHTMASVAKGEALHRLHVLAEMGVFPNYVTKVRSVLSQKYSGDITIFPEISYAQFPRVLSNPTTEYMLQATLAGERATWPKLSRIQNHCSIELALDDAVQKLRARVVFSPSQVDLRLNAFGRPTSAGSERGRNRRTSRGRLGRPHSIDTKALPANTRHAHFQFQVTDTGRLDTPPLPPRPPNASPADILTSDTLSSSADADDDTSTLSPTDESLTSPVESPPSAPELWPTGARQLFPTFASQPCTPNIASKTFAASPIENFRNSMIMTSSAVGQPQQPRPSSPELRYKRLFHPPPPTGAEGVPVVGGGVPQAGGAVKERERRGSGGQGLQLDISGTRGMMLRRKKSASRG
ncbi:hypothetical protein W97_01871 [Coniosporium apollinis CBS 100218]|uniref:Patatin-like phospholipase domain-containing protein n=1 Tax=Coniosporium apollinis (strain CBS 100218) TaxID=1168221 RepID=R7YL55_CONA1|nr:uncharacterized protein W97_01871 [Coniosporium apollinis CBS 100218]EON62647.1 hypothetical protein W97_01871 [Coniosporium apollinis CBS 100218]